MTMMGYVQAGGGSSRFGSDKALSMLGGRTMLARTVSLVASVCAEVKIVAPVGRYADAPALILADRWPGQGPLGGILTALHHLNQQQASPAGARVTEHGPYSHALIISCDLPFLTPGWLAFLCQRALRGDAQVVVPQSATGLEPLCACWRSDAAGPLQAAFDSGIRKVTEAMKRLKMETLDEPVWKRFDTDGRLFWNMNTAMDHEEARRILEVKEQ